MYKLLDSINVLFIPAIAENIRNYARTNQTKKQFSYIICLLKIT